MGLIIPFPQLKRYLEELPGQAVHEIWTDIPNINPQAKERLGFQTQKPLELMKRIIETSSRPGDMVLDPFCGCATTIEAAHRLGRNWVGIDIAVHAVKRVAQVRLQERLGLVLGEDFEIEGVPLTLEGAQDLWQRDRYHFQKWAVEQIDGFVTTKKSADGGIDGRIYFAVPDEPDLQSMVVEVKGGQSVNIGDWRSLRGVLDANTALLAGLITMHPITGTKLKNFRRYAADLEPLQVMGVEYPRMQILSVEEILNGARFRTPSVAGQHTLEPRLPGITA